MFFNAGQGSNTKLQNDPKKLAFQRVILIWRGGSHYFNLTGSKILARVGQISVAFPSPIC